MADVESAAEELATGLDWIAHAAPGAAHSFRALIASTAGHGWESPSLKGRALLALALATAGGCDRCIARQARAAAKAGADRDEVVAALQRAVMIADGSVMAIAAEALAMFDDLVGGSVVVPAAGRLTRERPDVRHAVMARAHPVPRRLPRGRDDLRRLAAAEAAARS